MNGPAAAPEVRVVDGADAAATMALAELEQLLAHERTPLVSFATGATFTGLLGLLAGAIQRGRIRTDAFVATHLDEYLGFGPDRRGGMVHELCALCPPLLAMLRAGTFLPVPPTGDAAGLAAHAERMRRQGGIRLQFLGIGRNGHLGFNEPGTPLDSGFHTADLSPATREDARPRFPGEEPPQKAVTAGIGTILGAQRCVLLACGAHKAAAVAAMLRGRAGPHCPASALQSHGNALVVLDREAAGGLEGDRRR
jgi:glucosamine-6-phosphate deaminase